MEADERSRWPVQNPTSVASVRGAALHTVARDTIPLTLTIAPMVLSDIQALFDKPARRALYIAAGLLAVHQLLALAAPYLVKVAIDDGIGAGRVDVLWIVGAVGLAIYAGSAISRFFGTWLVTKAGEEAWFRLRNRLFEHVQGMSLLGLRERRVGGLVSRINSDTYRIKQLAVSVVPSLISLIVGVGGAAIILLVLAPRLVLLALIPLPLGWIVLRWFRKYVRPKTKEKMEHHAALYSALHEALGGAEDVKALRAESEMARRVDESGRELRDAELELAWHRTRLGPMADLGISLVLLGTLVAGGTLAIQGAMTVGTVVVFYFYVSRSLGPIRRIPSLVYSWHSARAAMERIDELLSMDDALEELEEPVEADPGALALCFEGADFHYPPRGDREGTQALDGFELEVEAGGRVAILGPSGVGKSTTARLLLRLIEGDGGALRLQDVEIGDWGIGALRKRVGYVGQEVFLFDGTLRENLELGLDEAPGEEELWEAVELAGLKPVLSEARGGLDLDVGERGQRLSGGQRKRVALARALLRDPDLLIVDQMATDLEEGLNEFIFKKLCDRAMTLVYFGHRVPAGLSPHQVYWMERGTLRPYRPGRFEKGAPIDDSDDE